MTKSGNEKFIEAGFLVGVNIVLIKKITVKYGPKPNDRQDVPANTEGTVQGYAEEGIIVRFPLKDAKKTKKKGDSNPTWFQNQPKLSEKRKQKVLK